MDFKTAINNNLPIKKNKKPMDVSNWAQYCFKNGKIIRLDTPSEEENQQEIMKKISHAIELNRHNYMIKYDELHGEGAYDRLYYMEPIYNEVQLELDLIENDENENENDYENDYDYEYNVE